MKWPFVAVSVVVILAGVIVMLLLHHHHRPAVPANLPAMKSSRDLLRTLAKAVREEDVGAALYYGKVADDWQNAIAELLKGMHASWRLKQTLLRTHGTQAWSTFIKIGEERHGVLLNVIPDEESWDREITPVVWPEQTRDEAFFSMKETGADFRFISTGGAWFWDVRYGMGKFDPDDIIELYSKLEKSINRACDAAQQPNAKIEDVWEIVNGALKK